MAESLQRQRDAIALQLESQSRNQHFAAPKGIGPSALLLAVSPRRSFARPGCSPVPPEELNPQIHRAAVEQGLSPVLLRAVAFAESGFLPCAFSAKGAAGLMQIMPATSRDLGLVNPWDSQQSLTAGAKYLRQLLDRYNGDVRLALGAYNAGPRSVDRYGGIPPFDETRNYVHHILSTFKTSEPFDAVQPIAGQ